MEYVQDATRSGLQIDNSRRDSVVTYLFHKCNKRRFDCCSRIFSVTQLITLGSGGDLYYANSPRTLS